MIKIYISQNIKKKKIKSETSQICELKPPFLLKQIKQKLSKKIGKINKYYKFFFNLNIILLTIYILLNENFHIYARDVTIQHLEKQYEKPYYKKRICMPVNKDVPIKDIADSYGIGSSTDFRQGTQMYTQPMWTR